VTSAGCSYGAARDSLASVRRIVVKAGTNVLLREDGQVAIARLYGLAESITELKQNGHEVVLVSSGAIGLGAQRLRLGVSVPPLPLALKQACAAVGQGRLMALYADAFDRLGVVSAQILLTEEDFSVSERYHNLRTTLETLLSMGVVPILNENDSVSTLELERVGDESRTPVFGDNDKLSALITTKIEAQLLVLLSDVDGLFTADPSQVPEARVIRLVDRITPELLPYATGGKRHGRGGMKAKLEAARIATEGGAFVVIANGLTPGILGQVVAGDGVGTFFLAAT
jgi:glutamate 5-kinase